VGPPLAVLTAGICVLQALPQHTSPEDLLSMISYYALQEAGLDDTCATAPNIGRKDVATLKVQLFLLTLMSD
jgi:hypothetical protein